MDVQRKSADKRVQIVDEENNRGLAAPTNNNNSNLMQSVECTPPQGIYHMDNRQSGGAIW